MLSLLLQLEAFRKQKYEGKAKGAKGSKVAEESADNPTPSKTVPTVPPPPTQLLRKFEENLQHESQDRAAGPILSNGSTNHHLDQHSQLERPPADSRPSRLKSIPFSLALRGERLQNIKAAGHESSTAAAPVSEATMAPVVAGPSGHQPAAVTPSVLQPTKPLPPPSKAFSEAPLSVPLPVPPPLPLPPSPPQFTFRPSDAPISVGPRRELVGLREHAGSSSHSSGSGPVQLSASSVSSRSEEVASPSSEETQAESAGDPKLLLRDPFGSIFGSTEQPVRGDLNSSPGQQTARSMPDRVSSSPLAGAATETLTASTTQQQSEEHSPQRAQQVVSAQLCQASPAAQEHPASAAHSASSFDVGVSPVAASYAALSDGYLTPSRPDASSSRQQSAQEAEVLPVSRSAGLSRTDSASPGPSGKAEVEVGFPLARNLQGPSSTNSNGYAALSDGYLGRSGAGSEPTDSHRSQAGSTGRAGGGDRGVRPAWQSPARQSTTERSQAGSSFAELFDAVLSDAREPRKPSWLSPARDSTVDERPRSTQGSEQPLGRLISGNIEAYRASAVPWQQPIADMSKPSLPGPPPPLWVAARGVDESAAQERPSINNGVPSTLPGPASTPRLNGVTEMHPWMMPSPPLSTSGPVSGSGGDGGRERFAALQQHIDELTAEKYELLRGMAVQQKVTETLEAQNQAIAEDFNRHVRSPRILFCRTRCRLYIAWNVISRLGPAEVFAKVLCGWLDGDEVCRQHGCGCQLAQCSVDCNISWRSTLLRTMFGCLGAGGADGGTGEGGGAAAC